MESDMYPCIQAPIQREQKAKNEKSPFCLSTKGTYKKISCNAEWIIYPSATHRATDQTNHFT